MAEEVPDDEGEARVPDGDDECNGVFDDADKRQR